MAKSKWFRVAVEGETATDGRKIEKTWFTDIVATYNRATYGARVNMEHIRGFSPSPPFNAYGDVLAVRVQQDELQIGGKPEKRSCLYAQVEPTDALVAITKDKQKIYTSIEVAPNFAGTGKAGLVGLAVTDSPASLGTDVLEFSASGDPKAAGIKAMLDGRKQDAANMFSAAHETTFALEAEEAPQQPLKEALTSFFTDLLKGGGAKPEPEPTPDAAAAGDLAAFAKTLEAGFTKLTEAVDAKLGALGSQVTALRSDHDTLKKALDGQENLSALRPAATGGNGAAYVQSDC